MGEEPYYVFGDETFLESMDKLIILAEESVKKFNAAKEDEFKILSRHISKKWVVSQRSGHVTTDDEIYTRLTTGFSAIRHAISDYKSRPASFKCRVMRKAKRCSND